MREYTAYYWINDLKIVGKKENHIPYIYDKEKGWVIEPDHILSDRIIGYDGYEIGCSDMLFRVDNITEEEAMKLIGINLNINCPVCSEIVEKFDICGNCGWQNSGPDEKETDPRGPNKMSLYEARKAYKEGRKIE